MFKNKKSFLDLLINKKRRSITKTLIKDIILVLLICFLICVGIFFVWASTLKTPSLSSFDDRLLGQSAKIYDRTGKILLYDLSEKVRRTVIPFEEISPYVKNATIAIEDAEFYQHKGIRITSIFRAVIANIFSLKFSQGGSTITQQVVKNSLLTQKKNISRKVKEWILAIKLEKNASKDTILNMYLNEAPYGGSIYGIEEASSAFFDKKTKDLTLAEAAYLAALPQSPTVLSPYGKNKEKLEARKNLVLEKMLENKMISSEEYEKAKKEVVVFQPKSIAGIKAPHFVMFVKEYLEEKYGEELLSRGGLKITTTLDYELQEKAEKTIYNYVTKNGPGFKAGNAASAAINPKTGEILMMVGSKDYFDKNNSGNYNVTTAKRQPGSSFKPFAYVTAFMKGYTPETPVYDLETEFNVNCSPISSLNSKDLKCYSPQNYEGGFKGLMTFRSALAESRNIPAVKVLYLAGIEDTIKTATSMGIEDLGSPNQYGLTLALGGGEVSLLNMVSAYGVFANNGNKKPVVSVLKIETDKGVVLEEFDQNKEGKQVITEQSAKLLNSVLSDAKARSAIFSSKLFGDRQVALKTGTTNSSRDAWEIGYTPSISIGAWMGNNDNTPMAQQASARIVGPLWKELMDFALTKVPVELFETPEPYETGLKPFLLGEWRGPGNEIHSELYWINRKNPTGEAPGLNNGDEQFKNWEYSISNWAKTGTAETLFNQTTNKNNSFKIETPKNMSTLKKEERQTITVSGVNQNTSLIEYYLNGELIGKSTENPFSFSFIPKETGFNDYENELRAVKTSSNGQKEESVIIYLSTQ